MSPVSTAIREQDGGRASPIPVQSLPLPLDVRVGPELEIVVDWQMPSDTEHKN